MTSTRADWRVERDAALARDAVRRAGATIRPLRLPQLEVDPCCTTQSEPIDPFWRSAPPPEPVPQSAAASEPVPDSVLWAQVTGLPRVEGEGAVMVARRWWLSRREVWPTMVVQTVLARPLAPGAPDAHAALAHWDSETLGWAMLELGEAGLDPSTWSVRVSLTDWVDVPPAERGTIPSAPNAVPDPDPVFAALDDVEDAQRQLQRAEVRKVNAAVVAWRAAQADEGLPGAANTAYQKGFFVDLGMKLKVADSTAQALVTTAARLQRDLPAVWEAFQTGRHPWRAMQIVHVAIDGLDDALLPLFDERAVKKLAEIALPGLADALRRLKERLQPSTADERHERAAARRHYTIEPGADAMGWLHAFLPMADLLALDHQVSKAAVAALGTAAQGRGIRQLKADVFRDGMHGFLRRDADPADPGLLVPGRRGVEPRIAVLIPAMTVLGHSEAPAILQGYGPIGIKTALRLAGETHKAWVRVLTDQFTGAILSIGRKKYRPTKDMRTLLRLLDGGGRGPGCLRAPDETDIDHNRSFNLHDEQGQTAIDNLMLLSRRHHGIKTAGEADIRLLNDRTSIWITRSGNKYVTRPHDPPEPTPIPPELIDPDDCPF